MSSIVRKFEVAGVSLEMEIQPCGDVELRAVVFDDGYIPPSVRACVQSADVMQVGTFEMALRIAEEEQKVILSAVVSCVPERARYEMEQFAQRAHEWRLRLNERGKQDLIHLRVR